MVKLHGIHSILYDNKHQSIARQASSVMVQSLL